MIRRRTVNTGLPWRVYERYGRRIWRIYYQPVGATRVTLFECFAGDVTKAEARSAARLKYAQMFAGTPEADSEAITFERLGKLYMQWQRELPETDEDRKAETTLDENERELATLNKVFGQVMPDDITAPDWFTFQDLRRKAGASKKVNKEIALASAVLEYGRLRGLCTVNTARGIKRTKTSPDTRAVTLAEIDAVVTVARTMGPGATLQALAARAAWLCVRRPPEILALTPAQLGEDGILFAAAKRKGGEAQRRVLVAWSPELRATIADAQAVKRRVDISPLIFGTLTGTRYTKSGWGASWSRLMTKCAKTIEGFAPFSLMQCRPGGVTVKEERGDSDTTDTTAHADDRMVRTIYDRRRVRKGTPAA